MLKTLYVQALESLLNNYKARHVECLHSKELPGKYVVVEMWDEYAGLGNQFPSIITGRVKHFGLHSTFRVKARVLADSLLSALWK
jgi:hypothetical protein